MKVYKLKGVNAGMKQDHRSYSANQLSIRDSFINWMQASYIPKGGLGDVLKIVNDKMDPYNKFTAGKPPSYGAHSKTYIELKYNSKRQFELYTDNHIWWDIIANAVPGWAVRPICSPTQFYFLLPTAATQFDDETTRKRLDLTKNANTGKYISYWLANEGFGGGSQNVILCKDNKSPFIKITKGEYLTLLEEGIPRFYTEEKRKIQEAQQGVRDRVAAEMKRLDEKIARYKIGLKDNRDKYKSRLGELAMMESKQPVLNDLENGRDVFTSMYLTDQETRPGRFPIYKIDSAMAALCRKDKPQWIVLSWDYFSGTSEIEKQQNDAILNNFNFEYLYNFFFEPEKVKGVAYAPLRSPHQREVAVIAQASNVTARNLADKNVYFFEDYSTTTQNKKPVDWVAKLNRAGTTAIVTKQIGLEGNWLELKGHFVSWSMKKELPANFTLTYDVVAAKNFTWGAKGLTMQLAKVTSSGNAESYLKIKLRPGSDGKEGETTVETKFPSPPGYSNFTKWLSAPGFSNNKNINKVTVTVRKKEEKLLVYIDDKLIGEYDKAIPSAHLFNTISFDCGGNSSDNDVYYLSNIKIVKE
jgi:hypothetical protein